MSAMLSAEEIATLTDVLRLCPESVVWDLNAIYFVYTDRAVKVEAVSESPALQYPNEEALCIRVTVESPSPVFMPAGEPDHWYKVMCNHEPVQKIEILSAGVQIPGELVVLQSQPDSFVVDAGILVYTRLGVIPAVQLENTFGFFNWCDKPTWQRPEGVSAELPAKYSRRLLVR